MGHFKEVAVPPRGYTSKNRHSIVPELLRQLMNARLSCMTVVINHPPKVTEISNTYLEAKRLRWEERRQQLASLTVHLGHGRAPRPKVGRVA